MHADIFPTMVVFDRRYPTFKLVGVACCSIHFFNGTSRQCQHSDNLMPSLHQISSGAG